MEINGHQWTSMDIQRKSNEHHGQSVTVCLRWWACTFLLHQVDQAPILWCKGNME
jgi:hypothetical protein